MPLRFSEALPDDDDHQPPRASAPTASKRGGRKSIYGAVFESQAPAADEGSRRTDPKRERPERERPKRSQRKAEPERDEDRPPPRKRSRRSRRARDD
ncbi:MAG: hypothetical protein KDD82_24050, partial [Planctomycetes bacterium]|nr:hypothetical protein [Planctomycetota bacterium]